MGDFDDALRRVAAGGVALDPEVIQALVRSQSARHALRGLSERERDVLALATQGRPVVVPADAGKDLEV